MYWRWVTTAGTIASVTAGLVAALCFGYYDQFVEKLSMYFSIYALLFSIAAMVLVSFATKKNSDAALDVEAVNRNNYYKDRIRTWELQARIAMNQGR